MSIQVTKSVVDHPRSGVVIISVDSVCLSVCMYVGLCIKVERLDVGSSYLYIRYIQEIRVKFVYEGYRVKVEVKGQESLFSQCNTSIGNKPNFYKTELRTFARSMGFSTTADRMV